MSGVEQVPQLAEAELAGMTAEQITQAHQSGCCAQLLGQPVPVRLTAGESQLTEAEAAQLSPGQRADAYEAGRLRDLTGGPVAASGQG